MTEGEQEKSKTTKKSPLDTLIRMLVGAEKGGISFLVENAPLTLPQEAVDFLVSIAQYVAFLGAVLLFIGIFQFNVASIFFLAAFFLVRKSIKPLSKEDVLGWRMIFYAIILICIWGVVDGNIIKTLVLWFLGLYMLFQIRKEYK